MIVLLTFGTGIGSAVIHNGVLLPNTEFGHLEVGGKEAEHRAASSIKEAKDWSYERWTEEVTKVLVVVENAIWPDLFIAGGGISRKADKWIPMLKNRTPVVAAALQNAAGIVGAAMAAEIDAARTRLADGRHVDPRVHVGGDPLWRKSRPLTDFDDGGRRRRVEDDVENLIARNGHRENQPDGFTGVPGCGRALEHRDHVGDRRIGEVGAVPLGQVARRGRGGHTRRR